MSNKKICGLLILFLFAGNLQAQHAVFLKSGKVSFERKINIYAILPPFLKDTRQISDEQIVAFMQQYKASSPQFLTDSFHLFFDPVKTVYRPSASGNAAEQVPMIPIPATRKMVSDLTKRKVLSNKQLLDKSFFIVDSMKSIRWKLTDEIREIAGFSCKRANALLFDSVYVVAFYTEEILTKGGPGIFNGLPGMILGVALPHQHLSIFATKVYSADVSKEMENADQGDNNILPAIDNDAYNTEVWDLLKKVSVASGWLQIMINL